MSAAMLYQSEPLELLTSVGEKIKKKMSNNNSSNHPITNPEEKLIVFQIKPVNQKKTDIFNCFLWCIKNCGYFCYHCYNLKFCNSLFHMTWIDSDTNSNKKGLLISIR